MILQKGNYRRYLWYFRTRKISWLFVWVAVSFFKRLQKRKILVKIDYSQVYTFEHIKFLSRSFKKLLTFLEKYLTYDFFFLNLLSGLDRFVVSMILPLFGTRIRSRNVDTHLTSLISPRSRERARICERRKSLNARSEILERMITYSIPTFLLLRAPSVSPLLLAFSCLSSCLTGDYRRNCLHNTFLHPKYIITKQINRAEG